MKSSILYPVLGCMALLAMIYISYSIFKVTTEPQKQNLGQAEKIMTPSQVQLIKPAAGPLEDDTIEKSSQTPYWQKTVVRKKRRQLSVQE